jgi:hypothetical protein
MQLVRETITSFSVNFGLDPVTGLPTATPQLAPGREPAPVEEVFRLAEAVSAKKKIAIAFDEFQEVSRYGGDPLKSTFESAFSGTTTSPTFFPAARSN